MATHTLHPYPARGELPRWVGVGVAAGALAALVLHPGLGALLWGGVWGALLAATLGRLHGARLVAVATAFGAVLPTLVAFLAAAPLKGQPPVTGIVPAVLLVGVLVNGAWGLATGLALAFYGRARHGA